MHKNSSRAVHLLALLFSLCTHTHRQTHTHLIFTQAHPGSSGISGLQGGMQIREGLLSAPHHRTSDQERLEAVAGGSQQGQGLQQQHAYLHQPGSAAADNPEPVPSIIPTGVGDAGVQRSSFPQSSGTAASAAAHGNRSGTAPYGSRSNAGVSSDGCSPLLTSGSGGLGSERTGDTVESAGDASAWGVGRGVKGGGKEKDVARPVLLQALLGGGKGKGGGQGRISARA
jgi:hypothetical protein